MTDPEWKHLEDVRARVLARLPAGVAVEKVMYVPISVMEIEVYIFYPTDQNVKENERSGTSQTIQSMFEQELDRVSRGPKSGTELRFEFDSLENIRKNYEGSYYNRLR